ncbi:MAG TPA: OsmC family protein [Nitrospira sp.]
MKLNVAYHGGTRYDITSGTHRIVTDQPSLDGGQNAGMSPTELFVGSLASSVGYVVGQFCARHDIPSDGLTIDVEWALTDAPHRVDHIDLSIHLPHRITSDQKNKLLKVAQGCTVHQSIVAIPTVAIRLNPHSHHG